VTDPDATAVAQSVRLRPERLADIPAIRDVHAAAFGQQDEGAIVDRLRGAAGWDPALSIVAVDAADRLVGHVVLSPCRVEGGGGHLVATVLGLGPISVAPDSQRRGVGTALMAAALEAAERWRAPAVVLLGHPTYYPRFGFEPARSIGLIPPAPWPDAAWLACRLAAWAPALRGTVHYPDAFGIT
jgi:putative acetyltransferase